MASAPERPEKTRYWRGVIVLSNADMPSKSYSSVIAALERTGLACRGGFVPVEADGAPDLGGGRPAAFVVLAGNVGGSMWPAFSASAEFGDQRPDALDRWSRRILEAAARDLGGDGVCQAAFPFDGPPHLPFQRWAQKAEAVSPSPTGPLIHPEYGLWHAYRGALIFSAPLTPPPLKNVASPCLSCAGQPCLSACPVGAFRTGRYDVPACIAHLSSPAGTACNEFGCLARRACPVGQAHMYAPAQAAFHTRAFVTANLASTPKVPS
jgi:ferredoxin